MAYHNTEEFISEVEKRPALWDPSKEEYKNKNKKEEAWSEVCRSTYQNYEEKTEEEKKQIVKELQTRWKSIRDAYIRNFKKLKDESKSGRGAVKTHRYVFAEQLSFLGKVGENRGTTDTLVPNHVPDDRTRDANEKTSITQPKISVEPKKRKRNLLEEKLIKFMDDSEEKEDDDKDFFMSMVPLVRTLNIEQKIEFRMQVLAALQNIRSGHRGHSVIQDSRSSPVVFPTLQSQKTPFPQYPSPAVIHPQFFGHPAATNIHPHPVNTLENRAQVQPLAPSPSDSVPSPASCTSNNDNSVISVNDSDIQ
ncbi:uncharacterized protein LOC143033254 [Oratosquilla oratoria]|uniref:uncharacterized protein LOC143033254 n=1 Tax=Oratosquilla oratoria TaxID=337810 RepID=UPI003F762E05